MIEKIRDNEYFGSYPDVDNFREWVNKLNEVIDYINEKENSK